MRKFSYIPTCPVLPYSVASGPFDHHGEPDGHCCLPIKVVIPDGYEYVADIQGFISSAEHGDNYPWFSEHYSEILMGRNPDWYLFWFEVSADLIILNFYCKSSEEKVSMLLQSDLTDGRCLRFRFNVPHQNGKPDSRYDVCLDPSRHSSDESGITHSRSEVTEYFTGGYRIFTFTGASRTKSGDVNGDKYHTYVDEYVDE